MNCHYLCPKCNGHLKVGEHIIFVVRTRDGRSGLMLLSPELGDYRRIQHPSFELADGERIEFFCPLCQANLSASEYHQNLARIIMLEESGNAYDIVFSEIAGERCTYKIRNDAIESSFGEHSGHYTNFFGERRIVDAEGL